MDKGINKLNEVLNEMFSGVDTLLDTKRVVGEAKQIGDTTIVPLIEVSFGMAAGSNFSDTREKKGSRGGVGAKIKPAAVLVIKNGSTRIINVGKSSAIDKLFDMAPDLIDKFTKGHEVSKKEKQDIIDEAFKE